MEAENVRDLAFKIHARVRAVNFSKPVNAKLLAFDDCWCALVDVSLLLEAAHDGVGLTKSAATITLVKVGRPFKGDCHGRLRPKRAKRLGDRLACCQGTLRWRRCLTRGRYVKAFSRARGP